MDIFGLLIKKKHLNLVIKLNIMFTKIEKHLNYIIIVMYIDLYQTKIYCLNMFY